MTPKTRNLTGSPGSGSKAGIGRNRRDKPPLPGPKVPLKQAAALEHRPALHRIVGVGNGVETIAEGNFLPVEITDAAVFPNL